MTIHVRKGVVKIPIKLFYVLVLSTSLLVLLCIHVLKVEMEQDTLCTKELSHQTLSDSQASPDNKHVGCTKDPTYFNTWISCPECFRPTVKIISVNFTEIPRANLILPRGPPKFFKPRETKQQDFIRDVVLSPSSVCVDTCPFLLALQLSVSDRFNERNAIRTTWGSVAKTKIWPHANVNADFQILFVLAHQSKLSELSANVNSTPDIVTTPEVMALIRTEANRHGDMLYLDMIDSYFNLTLKLMSTLYWVQHHCPRTKFFLKVDADTFVNIPLLLDLLIYNEELLEFSITGHIYMGQKNVFRSGRWGVTKDLYPINMFPVYASGCAYVISSKAAIKVMELFPYFPILDLEDVYVTGILGKAAKLNYFSDNLTSLFTEYHSDKWEWCSFLNDTLVTGTGVNRKFKTNLIWSGFIFNEWECRTRNLITMPCHCEDEFDTNND